jgi:copper chaperone CopZ
MSIKNELGEMAGILSVDGNIDTKRITVEWEAPASLDTIKAKLKEINYPVT